MKKFNINNYIYVQINESGWQHLSMTVEQGYITNCIKNRKVVINGVDWYRLQCHNVFDLFPMDGTFCCHIGTTIMFDESDLL